MAELATRLPGLQKQLFRLLSRDIGKASLLAGDHSADERMAAFLLLTSRRFAARGFSASGFRLSMSRADIANYLHLTPKTVSRVLRRFQDDQWIRVQGRDLELIEPARIESLAAPVPAPGRVRSHLTLIKAGGALAPDNAAVMMMEFHHGNREQLMAARQP